MLEANRSVFPLQISGKTTLGILHNTGNQTAVIMLNGGAQIRAGSHRQYALLADALAQQGISSLRFDFPGYGDSGGSAETFIQHAALIPEICQQLSHVQPGFNKLILLGLCDGASAALLANPAKIAGCQALLLINPWFREPGQYAATVLETYYRQRLLSKDFWLKLVKGRWSLRHSLISLLQLWREKRQKQSPSASPHFTEVMLSNWQTFSGKTCVITAGADLTAEEFLRYCRSKPKAQQLLNHARHCHHATANHTFASLEQQAWLTSQVVTFVTDIAASNDSN